MKKVLYSFLMALAVLFVACEEQPGNNGNGNGNGAMKICMRERCERMQINEWHQAACWMNVKDAFEKGELEEVTE